MQKIVINGRIPSKKNSKQIVFADNRPVLVSSKKHKQWHKDAMQQLLLAGVKVAKIERCSVDVTIYFPDNRKADLTNKVESIMDLLVDYGVIEDDRWQVVHTLSLFGVIDKENPRAEISIYPAE